jgi:hypothetical protein
VKRLIFMPIHVAEYPFPGQSITRDARFKRDDRLCRWRYCFPMSNQNHSADPDPNTAPKPPAENETPKAPKAASEGDGDAKELTPEEQMAAYEEAMKNEDWGHQPC